MARSDLTKLSATELAYLYRRRELSPVEVTEAVLDRVDELDPKVNAFFTRTPELARAGALESEKRFAVGQPCGVMDGIPYSIKDLEATKGIRTTWGIPKFKDHVPTFDTAIAERLRSSGGVLLGKTAAPHLGYKDSSENLVFPPARNPWNLSRNPGGSSSGAAAAVAAGFGPIAQGSDGAGSIRIPSALCGVVGFKATFGLVPVWPQKNYWGSTVCNGPITRNVYDAALMLDVMAGEDIRDPTTGMSGPPGGFLGALERSGPRTDLRIVVSTDYGYGATALEVSDAVVAAANRLATTGHSIEFRDPGWADPGLAQETRWTTAFAAGYADYLAESPDDFEDSLRDIVLSGQNRGAADVLGYQSVRGALSDAVANLFMDADYLVTPTMPLTAWPLHTYPTEADGKPLPGGGNLLRAYLVFPFNFTGNPAITIPCGLGSDGLPIGLQVVGRMHDDLGVLRVAAELESVIGFSSSASVEDRD